MKLYEQRVKFVTAHLRSTWREGQRDRDRQTERQRDRDGDGERQRDREREREREAVKKARKKGA